MSPIAESQVRPLSLANDQARHSFRHKLSLSVREVQKNSYARLEYVLARLCDSKLIERGRGDVGGAAAAHGALAGDARSAGGEHATAGVAAAGHGGHAHAGTQHPQQGN